MQSTTDGLRPEGPKIEAKGREGRWGWGSLEGSSEPPSYMVWANAGNSPNWAHLGSEKYLKMLHVAGINFVILPQKNAFNFTTEVGGG